ncbi:MAG: hypothetical protein R2713_21330 [Ilumatobacteraceae bacterium]
MPSPDLLRRDDGERARGRHDRPARRAVGGDRPRRRGDGRRCDRLRPPALALQNWFRDEFDYSLGVQRPQRRRDLGVPARARIGYCEQFAGTFASWGALARHAAAAVGFTQGELRSDGQFHVLGKGCHAWPGSGSTGWAGCCSSRRPAGVRPDPRT